MTKGAFDNYGARDYDPTRTCNCPRCCLQRQGQDRTHPMPGWGNLATAGQRPPKLDLRTTPGQLRADQMRDKAVTGGLVGRISAPSWGLGLSPDAKISVMVTEDISPANIDALVDDLREIQRQSYAVKSANAAAPFVALREALAAAGDPAGCARAGDVYKRLIAAGYTVSKLRPRA